MRFRPNAAVLTSRSAVITERVDLYTYVTCPTMRYHPAVVAQQAATVQILADGRFTLALGSGENLNEHVVGKGWPAIAQRQDMLREAIEIIRALFGGGLVDWRGDHYQVDSARLWDLPNVPVGIAVAMGGKKAIEKFAVLADHLVAVEPAENSCTSGTPHVRPPGWPEEAGSSGRSRPGSDRQRGAPVLGSGHRRRSAAANRRRDSRPIPQGSRRAAAGGASVSGLGA
jgi:hypothetical protein